MIELSRIFKEQLSPDISARYAPHLSGHNLVRSSITFASILTGSFSFISTFLNTQFKEAAPAHNLVTMANYLASIFGTEQDKVNCSFYYKIGACRHGDRCSRKHVKPSYSQTILMPNMYQNPAYDPKNKMNPSQLQNHFDAFYEDVWCEMCKYGELEELVVCDNNNDRKLELFPAQDSTHGAATNVSLPQILSATSTPGSSTKKMRKRPATL